MIFLPLMLAIHAPPTDRDLVLRLQRRDPQALAELYDRYGRIAFALILRVVRDNRIAEDLVQETFLRLWNRVHAFEAANGALGPWLLSLARNRAIDYLRSGTGRDRRSLDLEAANHPSLYTCMESDLLFSDSARRVNSAIQKLSAQQREVVELAYFEGLSQSEMADRLGQPLATVQIWLRAALNSLRDDLRPGAPA